MCKHLTTHAAAHAPAHTNPTQNPAHNLPSMQPYITAHNLKKQLLIHPNQKPEPPETPSDMPPYHTPLRPCSGFLHSHSSIQMISISNRSRGIFQPSPLVLGKKRPNLLINLLMILVEQLHILTGHQPFINHIQINGSECKEF